MPRAYGTHLYILSLGDDLIKVGRSMDVPRRFAEHRKNQPWGDLKLVATFPDVGFCEPWVLRALAAYERRGEWVRCSAQQALHAVSECLV
jgi:hypothetical protein